MKKKIIVIEDNFEVRDNLCEILQLAGYETFQASNGIEGIELISKITPDLVICDVMMPKLDGFGVLKIMNKSNTTKFIPVIFLTAKSEKDAMRKGMGLGAADYIVKPFDDTELLEAIEIRIAKNRKIEQNTLSDHLSLYTSPKSLKLIDQLIADKETRTFSPKEYIYKAHQNLHFVYWLEKGLVKLTSSNSFGKQLTSALISANHFVGLDAVLMESPTVKDLICLTETTVRLIPHTEFTKLVESNTLFSNVLLRHFAELNMHNQRRCLEFAYFSVSQKVASALLMLDDVFEPNPIDVSREDIAELAGIAKESTIRTLSELKSVKVIRVTGSKINILNKQALINMLN